MKPLGVGVGAPRKREVEPAENRIETYPWYHHLSTYRTPAGKGYTDKEAKKLEENKERMR